MCPKFHSIDPSSELIVSRKSNNVNNFQVFTLFARTKKANTRIVYAICTVILSRARPCGLVVVVSVWDYGTGGPGSNPGWAPIMNCSFFLIFLALYC